VAPGTVITYKPNSLSKRVFYRMPKSFSKNRDHSQFSDSVERLKEVMYKTMEVLMRHGEDEKGVYLSGGVDSSLLAVTASEAAKKAYLHFYNA
jgi:asparagine synthetase B (glutamine-hydrolysing)